jgi:hypothetical protein
MMINFPSGILPGSTRLVSTTMLLVATACATASAQVQDVTAFAAIATERAALHSGNGSNFYRVGELASGALVLVDGEGGGWSRVSYPSDATAFVRVEDVTVEGTSVKIKEPTRLKAANSAAGYSGSWRALLSQPLPAGTMLKIVEPAKEGESVVGYRVQAPEAARAFVETRLLRKATEAEAVAIKSRIPAPAPTPAAPSTTPAPTTPAAAPGTDLTAPIVTAPGGTPTVPPTTPGPVTITQETAANPAGTQAGGTPATTPVAVPETPEQRRWANVTNLERTFQNVWRQPILAAEVDELMAQYDAALAEETNANRRRSLQQRRDALQLRVDFRNQMRSMEESRAQLDQQTIRLSDQIRQLEASRYYTIVGQLQPSTVYDGQRLPLMYRVVSVGGSAPRTLGYIKKTERFDLDAMLGRVVGVIGDAVVDRSLQLNIITPIYVDQLRSDGSREAVPTADGSPSVPPATGAGSGAAPAPAPAPMNWPAPRNLPVPNQGIPPAAPAPAPQAEPTETSPE